MSHMSLISRCRPNTRIHTRETERTPASSRRYMPCGGYCVSPVTDPVFMDSGTWGVDWGAAGSFTEPTLSSAKENPEIRRAIAADGKIGRHTLREATRPDIVAKQ